MTKFYKPTDRVQVGLEFDKLGVIVSGPHFDRCYKSNTYYNVNIGTHIIGYDVSLIKLSRLLVLDNAFFKLEIDGYNKTLRLKYKK